MTDTNEVTIQNLFDAITEAIVNGQDYRVDALVRYADVASTAVDGIVDVIDGLNHTLVQHQPSDKFLRQLKRDLTDEPQNVIERLASVPGRVHIATIAAAIIAGFMWLTRRKEHPNDDKEQTMVKQSS